MKWANKRPKATQDLESRQTKHETCTRAEMTTRQGTLKAMQAFGGFETTMRRDSKNDNLATNT